MIKLKDLLLEASGDSSAQQKLRNLLPGLVRMSLKTLRELQDDLDDKIKRAYQQKNTKALRNLQSMRNVVDAAVNKKEFGED